MYMYILHMKIKKREEILRIVEEIIKNNLFKSYTFNVWRQLSGASNSYVLIRYMNVTISRIPLRTKFPINTPSNNDSFLA